MRPITVVAEFLFELKFDGKVAAEIECCATADVLPGSPPRPWHDDPGSGPEVEGFRDILIDCGGYSREAGRHVCDWVEPDKDFRLRIQAWLCEGNADVQFEEAALDAGGYADYRRDLMAAQ